MQLDVYRFSDDGRIPNSRLPLLHYRQVSVLTGPELADWFEEQFTAHHWLGTWRNGILPYTHYHSTSHEVLGIYQGTAMLQVGGEHGPFVPVAAGDVLVIPAGVGHKNGKQSADFGVVGAYPDGRAWDLLRGEAHERPRADQNIAQVPMPQTDPLFGKSGPLIAQWRQ